MASTSSYTFSRDSIKQVIFIAFWWAKKRAIIFARMHLSHLFALLLAMLIVVERLNHVTIPKYLTQFVTGEYFSVYQILLWVILLPEEHPGLWLGFIIFISLLTIVAAIWEFFGNKLAISDQEVLFITGINKVLQTFNRFQCQLGAEKDPKAAGLLLQNFLNELLMQASLILCGKHEVDVAFMVYNKEINALVLDKEKLYQSPFKEKGFPKFFRRKRTKEKYEFPENLVIPLGKKPDEQIGPAEIAFIKKKYIAHMPKKKNEIGLIYDYLQNEEYVFKEFFQGWYPAKNRKHENFRSILSVPVTSSISEKQTEIFGVLNFTTRKRDLFIHRDYVIATCFATLISQAMDANRKKLAELAKIANPAEKG